MSITATCKLDLDRGGSFGTDISDYLLSASVKQGRRKSLDPINHAVATIKLNNRDGRFSPKNTGSPYYPDFHERNCGIRVRGGSDVRCFSGFITQIDQDPYIGSQEVVVTAVDRLSYAAGQLLKAGKFRRQPVNLILNRILDRLERGEEVTNPGGENGSTTGYTAIGSASLSAPNSSAFEGDYCIQAICDGSASGQGWRYDFGAASGSFRRIAIAARTTPGDGNATLTIRGLDASLTELWTTTIDVVDSAWTYWRDSGIGRTSHRYIELKTGSAVALTIQTDCLHQVAINYGIARSISSTLDAVAELVACYDEPALSVLEKLVATEAGGFLWMGNFQSLYGTVYASCQAARSAITTPVATFADDGSGVLYSGFRLDRDATEVISEARVSSEGDYEAEDEETTIWEYSPLPLAVPASTSVILHAAYSSPARLCSLVANTSEQWETYQIAAGADDGCLRKTGTTYPPDGTPTSIAVLVIGQAKIGSIYYKDRVFLRWDTSDIGAGATVSGVMLAICPAFVAKEQAWTLQARQPGGSSYDWSPLDSTDWSATPGNDTLRGSLASSSFPPAGPGNWFGFTLDLATINKTGITALYLCSSRDVGDNPPAAYKPEQLSLYQYGSDWAAKLLVKHDGVSGATKEFTNYGAGADIKVTAGSKALSLAQLKVTGEAYLQSADESLAVVEATNKPDLPRSLDIEMPHQGGRTSEMKTEAQRLADRYDADASVDRVQVDLTEQDSSSLTQMQSRVINDLVTVKNVQFDYSTKVNGNFFIEGLDWQVTDQGKVLAVTLQLEQK